MELSRRSFLKLSGAAVGGVLLPVRLSEAKLAPQFELHKPIGEGRSICPYCSCGCGILVATDHEGHITNSEGDPDHIINMGALDPKSLSVRQLANSDRRLRRPLYRAAGTSEWQEMTWDQLLPMVAEKIKGTRDATFEQKEGDVTVNRTRGIAFLGGAANNDEDCYLAVKLARALGIVYIEHQARI